MASDLKISSGRGWWVRNASSGLGSARAWPLRRVVVDESPGARTSLRKVGRTAPLHLLILPSLQDTQTLQLSKHKEGTESPLSTKDDLLASSSSQLTHPKPPPPHVGHVGVTRTPLRYTGSRITDVGAGLHTETTKW